MKQKNKIRTKNKTEEGYTTILLINCLFRRSKISWHIVNFVIMPMPEGQKPVSIVTLLEGSKITWHIVNFVAVKSLFLVAMTQIE